MDVVDEGIRHPWDEEIPHPLFYAKHAKDLSKEDQWNDRFELGLREDKTCERETLLPVNASSKT